MRPEGDGGQPPGASAYSEQARVRAGQAQRQAEEFARRSDRREARALAARTRLEQLRRRDERELANDQRTRASPRERFSVDQSPMHEGERFLPRLPPPP